MKILKKIIEIVTSEKFVKFFIAGILAFIVDTAVLNVLKFKVFHGNEGDAIFGIISIPKLISSCFGITTSFSLNRYWSFKEHKGKLTAQASKYIMVFVVNIFIASILFGVYERIIENLPVIKEHVNFIPTIANIITTGTIMFISYFFYNKFVFNGKPSSELRN